MVRAPAPAKSVMASFLMSSSVPICLWVKSLALVFRSFGFQKVRDGVPIATKSAIS
jgi:hypothetical protein